MAVSRAMNWQTHISFDPSICHGQPVITGTRIPVSVVLANVAENISADELISSYPSLTIPGIRAAIAYAAELANDQIVPLTSASAAN